MKSVPPNFRAFTLVEVMVALAVFLILVLLVTQLVTETSRSTMRENNKMDSVSDMRQALDRFGNDWSARIRRSDVDWQVSKTSGNDQIAMLSRVPAYEGARKLATVSYRVNPDTFTLERGTLGYNWEGSGPRLIFASTSATPAAPADTAYETLSPCIFRWCISFLDRKSGKWLDAAPGELNSEDVGGVVISVAALDGRNRGILSTDQLKALSEALEDTEGSANPLESWTKALNDAEQMGGIGVPPAIAAAVRLHQRVFYVEE